MFSDIGQAVAEEDTRGCDAKLERLLDKCNAGAKSRCQIARRKDIASQGWQDCLSGIKYWPPCRGMTRMVSFA